MTGDSSAVEAFSPRGSDGMLSTAFVTDVMAASATVLETYTFYNHIRVADAAGTSAGVAVQIHTFYLRNGQLSADYSELTYDRGLALTLKRFCAAPCAGLTLTPTATGFGVAMDLASVTFAYSVAGTTVANPSTTPVVMTGRLVGEMPAGYAFAAQLPRATQGSLSVAGVAAPVRFAEVSYTSLRVADPTQFPTVVLKTAAGHLEVITTTTDLSTPIYRARLTNRASGEVVQALLPTNPLTATPDGFAVTLNAVTLTSSGSTPVVVTAALTVGKPGGSMAIAGDGAFKPQYSVLAGASQTLTYEFQSPTTGPLAFEQATLKFTAGALKSFTAASGSGKVYACDAVGSMFMAKCEGTVSISADGRTLTFNGFKAGLQLSPTAGTAFTGSLTTTGL